MNIIRVTENLPLSLMMRRRKAESGAYEEGRVRIHDQTEKLAALMRMQMAAEAEMNPPAKPRWDNTIGDFIEV